MSSSSAQSQIEYRTIKDIAYYHGGGLTTYQRERCRLDLYYPTTRSKFATVVWFHGGGLKNGEKKIPEGLQEKGLAVVAVNYRLHPTAKSPAYVEDAAASVAWAFKNIEQYGGSADKVFVSGHSAGGYLTAMVGLDERWLDAHGVAANHIAGLIPYSGQTVTHSTIREELGIAKGKPIINDMAPLFHARSDAPPLLLITGDRELEMNGRYEENAYLWRMMKEAGHSQVTLYELDGYGHSPMAEPAHPLAIRFIRSVLEVDQ